MCASSLIFKAIKWCFFFGFGGLRPPNRPPGPPTGALPLDPARGPVAPWTPAKLFKI